MYNIVEPPTALKFAIEIGEFESIYWSSTQQSDFFAWIQNFNAGSQNYDGKYANRKVRAIRSF